MPVTTFNLRTDVNRAADHQLRNAALTTTTINDTDIQNLSRQWQRISWCRHL